MASLGDRAEARAVVRRALGTEESRADWTLLSSSLGPKACWALTESILLELRT